MAYRIVVDAGHGGDDPGAVSGNLREKDFNLRAANYMYDRFKELGIPVYITRSTDETVDRETRLNRINNAFGNDPQVILLSNHINAGGAEGAEVVYALRNNDTLAKNVLAEIGNEGQVTRRYYQRRLPEDPSKDYYFIMRETGNITPLLIEYGFIDNTKDATKLQNNLLDYVEGVVKAVANYTGYNYVPPGESVQNKNTYVVKSGDTLYKIANQFNTTVDILKSLNNLTSNTLSVGQVLNLPVEEENITDYILYTVKSGDSLYKIATQYNTTIKDIIDFNNLESTLLSIGQQLKIPTKQEQKEYYIVVKGDSLYQIAKKLGVTVDDLIKANNLVNTTLQIGDKLLIPTKQPEIPEENYINYTVVSGDSLYKIANRYNITVDRIKQFNNLTSNLLQIGQVLKIPTETEETNYIIYTVKSGDSLYKIATQYNTTVSEIKELNNLTSNILSIGQTLRIPNNS